MIAHLLRQVLARNAPEMGGVFPMEKTFGHAWMNGSQTTLRNERVTSLDPCGNRELLGVVLSSQLGSLTKFLIGM